jgi:hypothetical protein
MSKYGSILVGRATLSQLICFIGLIIGMVAFFLPWGANPYSFSGLDMLLGNAPGLSGIHTIIPLVVLVLAAVLSIFVLKLMVISMNAMIVAYIFIIVGFMIIGLTVLFGIWQPQPDFKMILNGDLGIYLSLVSGTVVIVSGIIDL